MFTGILFSPPAAFGLLGRGPEISLRGSGLTGLIVRPMLRWEAWFPTPGRWIWKVMRF